MALKERPGDKLMLNGLRDKRTPEQLGRKVQERQKRKYEKNLREL